MSFIPELFENLKEYTAADLYDMVMKSYYFPMCYILHAIFICANLRYTSPGKTFPWYRSFILGFLMTAGPRYVFGKLSDRLLKEFHGKNEALITFAIIWACFNLCPFDLIFKFSMRPSSKVIIKCLDAFSQAQNLIQLCYSGAMIFERKPMTVITINIFCMCIPILIDAIDRYLIGQRKFPMAYDFNYIKRMVIGCIVVVICGTNVFDGLYINMNNMFLYTSIIFIVLAMIDYYMTEKMFGNADLLFPEFWRDIATYYPTRAK